jgi:hypothetical protein
MLFEQQRKEPVICPSETGFRSQAEWKAVMPDLFHCVGEGTDDDLSMDRWWLRPQKMSSPLARRYLMVAVL